MDKMATRTNTVCLVVFAVVLCSICFGMYGIFVDQKSVEKILSSTERSVASGDEQFVAASDVLHFQIGTFIVNQQKSLIRYIKRNILGPSLESYYLRRPTQTHFSQAGQDKFVDNTLHQLRNGFFVECGAADGESFSNTLFFEKYRNWTGLLIEANPGLYSTLLRKQRKSYSINACLSVENVPKMMTFKPVGLMGGIADSMDEAHKRHIKQEKTYNQEVRVQCFPFFNIMEALGRNHINYLSLDVEGPELQILKNIPWKDLRIDVISVEYRVWDANLMKMKLQSIRKFILGTGLYREAKILPEKSSEATGLDVIFKRRDLNV